MDCRFTPQEQAFRGEVSAFLDQVLPNGWAAAGDELGADDDDWAFTMSFFKRLAQKGWICPHWPKEYGGAGMNVMEQLVYKEELAYRGAPWQA